MCRTERSKLTDSCPKSCPADAVSFKSDDINVTAQRVMTQTATLMAACSPADACIINYEEPD